MCEMIDVGNKRTTDLQAALDQRFSSDKDAPIYVTQAEFAEARKHDLLDFHPKDGASVPVYSPDRCSREAAYRPVVVQG